jgi:molecular chaperone GrpE
MEQDTMHATSSSPVPTPEAQAPGTPGEAATTPAGELEAALTAKEKEVERLQDRLLRLQAEFENFKRRAARDKAEFVKFANEGVLLEMLPVLDNLERAIDSARAEARSSSLVEGIDMVVRLFRTGLEKFGVRPIQAAGSPFDPAVHQAVAQVETAAGEDGQVLEEIQRGYLLEGRVLRPAMVKVSRVAAPAPSAGAAEPGDRA